MKKIFVSVIIVLACVFNISLLTENESSNFDLALNVLVNKAFSQIEWNSHTHWCYDGYDSPSFWVDDEFKRICSTCDMYEGHDFCELSTCVDN